MEECLGACTGVAHMPVPALIYFLFSTIVFFLCNLTDSKEMSSSLSTCAPAVIKSSQRVFLMKTSFQSPCQAILLQNCVLKLKWHLRFGVITAPAGQARVNRAPPSAVLRSVSIMLSRCWDVFMRSRWVAAPLPPPLVASMSCRLRFNAFFADDAGVGSRVAPVVSEMIFIAPVPSFIIGFTPSEETEISHCPCSSTFGGFDR